MAQSMNHPPALVNVAKGRQVAGARHECGIGAGGPVTAGSDRVRRVAALA